MCVVTFDRRTKMILVEFTGLSMQPKLLFGMTESLY